MIPYLILTATLAGSTGWCLGHRTARIRHIPIGATAAQDHAAFTEAAAQAHANTHVTLTLVDGTKVNGYLSDVGYSGLRLMVNGRTSEWRFSAIEAIEPMKRR